MGVSIPSCLSLINWNTGIQDCFGLAELQCNCIS